VLQPGEFSPKSKDTTTGLRANRSLVLVNQRAWYVDDSRISTGQQRRRRRTVYLYASRRFASTWDYQISI